LYAGGGHPQNYDFIKTILLFLHLSPNRCPGSGRSVYVLQLRVRDGGMGHAPQRIFKRPTHSFIYSGVLIIHAFSIVHSPSREAAVLQICTHYVHGKYKRKSILHPKSALIIMHPPGWRSNIFSIMHLQFYLRGGLHSIPFMVDPPGPS